MNDSTLTSHEKSLLAESDFQAPFAAEQLKAGRNNQVYRVEDATGRRVALKRYFHHLDDERDRLDHEWRFLAVAHRNAPHLVPQPIAHSREHRCALLEFVEGKTYRKSVRDEDIRQAIEFVIQLNATPPAESALPIAADACFSMSDHVSLLKNRIDRLENLPQDSFAREFAINRLTPAALDAIASVPNDRQTEPQIVSPSDFGFHNALARESAGPCFLDFEYAGWDGPGKLVADFFSQPEIRVDDRLIPDFLAGLESVVTPEQKQQLKASLPIILSLHGLKWCCILLNGFLQVDAARRVFSGDSTTEAHQLEKAESYFAEVCEPRLTNYY